MSYSKEFTLKFRTPRGAPEGTAPRAPLTISLALPSAEEYPEGYLLSLAENTLVEYAREKINKDEAVDFTNIFAQYLADVTTRGPAISEETWAKAVASWKEYLEMLGKPAETIASLGAAFKAGFRTRYSPEVATKLQIGVQKWYVALSEANQAEFELVADKLNKKLESYKFEDTSALVF